MFTAISAVLLGLSQPAHAQGAPKFEVAGGYQYMHDSDTSYDFSKGWMFSVGADVASWFAVVGEIGGSYKTIVSGVNNDLSLTEYTYLVGPKLTATSRAPVAPFVQALFGAANGSISLGNAGSNISVSGTHFAFQPGAGVDINPSPNFGIRLEADGRAIKTDTDTDGQWRFIAAVVFRK
jgi:opacity protein-like surface antigen